MWSQIPFDLLAKIFSFLSPDSLARAKSSCKHWHTCAKAYPIGTTIVGNTKHHPLWFLAMHVRNCRLFCYVHNPACDRWHSIPFDFLSDPIRPIASVGSLILFRPAISSPLQLALCNPFTRQYKVLPYLNIPRTNPAVGVVEFDTFGHRTGTSSYFRVYVAGGMSEAPHGGASYEATLEMYDSQADNWQLLDSMPMEFAVRLTVWTPNESVYSDGVLYWITSARAYSVMGFEVGTSVWKEVKVPMADRLEFAALVRWKGRLVLVGGACGGEGWIWELVVGSVWVVVEIVPPELGRRFLKGRGNWCNVKCVGADETVYLYRDLGSEMLVWREASGKGKWEWCWVGGCPSIRGEQVPNFPIKGVLLHPSLASSSILDK